MPRYQLTREDRSKGGKTRSQQPSFRDACSKGFWSTMDKHPYFARKHLKHIIRAYNTRNHPQTMSIDHAKEHPYETKNT